MEEEREYYNTTYPPLEGHDIVGNDTVEDHEVVIRKHTDQLSKCSSIESASESSRVSKPTSTKRKVPSIYDEDMYSLPTVDEKASSAPSVIKDNSTPKGKNRLVSPKCIPWKSSTCCIVSAFIVFLSGAATAGLIYFIMVPNVAPGLRLNIYLLFNPIQDFTI